MSPSLAISKSIAASLRTLATVSLTVSGSGCAFPQDCFQSAGDFTGDSAFFRYSHAVAPAGGVGNKGSGLSSGRQAEAGSEDSSEPAGGAAFVPGGDGVKPAGARPLPALDCS